MPHTHIPAHELERRLVRANEIRSYRSAIKRELSAGRVSLPDLLTSPPPDLRSMQVGHLVRALPGVADVKARQLLARVNVPATTRVGMLTLRQRMALVQATANPCPYSRAA